MDTMSAFAMGEVNRGKEMKVFDWDKAVELIKEHGIRNATAGLELDMEWTSGTILKDGKPVMDDYTYLGSIWAIPILLDDDTDEEYECWIMDSKTKYDEDTKWPESALKALTEVKE